MAILPNANPIKVYWHNPQPIFAARVNAPGTMIWPIQDISFDGVTVGAYTDCHADMSFTLGSAAGLDDYGRGRLRQVPTSTTLKVGRSSQGFEDGQLNIVDNAYITVYEDYRVHAKIPVIGPAPNYTEHKDTDIPVGDRTEEPPPVANLGSDFAGSIDPNTDTLTVFFAGSNSFAVADAATIASYAWIAPGGTFVNGTSATTADVYIEFPAGAHWVRLTVTDSNGKTMTGHRFVLADDPANSLCVSGMQVQSITRTQQGCTARLRVLVDLPRSSYPDGAKVIIFEDRVSLDGVSRDHVLFNGWHQTDQASSRALETHLQRATELLCVDILGRLDSLPGFPQRLEVPDEVVGLTWGEMPTANMDKFLVYLIQWHSTASQVADFFTSGTWAAYPFVIFDAVGDTLYNQLQRQANRIVPDHDFMSDRDGTLRVVVNPQYQDTADRTITIQNSLTENSWSAIEFGYQRPPRVHTLRGSALLTQTAWLIVDSEKELSPPVFAIAPGTAPGQGGRESTLGERLAQSQADLNAVTGHHYAHMNARYGEINVTLNLGADAWDFNPAAHTWVQLLTSSASAPQRGLDFINVRCLCKEVTVDFSYGEEGTTWRGRVALERETVGLPALTDVKEEALPVGDQPVAPFVPDFGLIVGAQVVAGIGVMGDVSRTSNFQNASPTWDSVYFTHGEAVEPELLQCFVVDPFSPGYIDTPGGAINGWAVNQDGIWRLTDLFGATPGAALQHAFATTDAMYQGTYAIAASFGEFVVSGNPWIVVIAAVNRAGTTIDADDGVWAIYSQDAGATWSSEIRVSLPAQSDVSYHTRQRPTVWTSPRTPGYAITFSYTAQDLVEAYKTTDWGATWSKFSSVVDSPTFPLPLWVLYNDATSTTISSSVAANVDYTVSASGGVIQTVDHVVLLAMPKDAKRVILSCYVNHTVTTTNPTFTSTSADHDTSVVAGVTQVEDLTFVQAPDSGGTTQQYYTVTFTRTSPTADWPGNRETAEVTPPTNETLYCRFDMFVNAQGSSGETATSTLRMTAEVIEIEMEDGTIFMPGENTRLWSGEGMGGGIHVPWQDNASESIIYYGRLIPGTTDLFALHRWDGTISTDITPTDATGGYGPYRGLFGLRAHDSDRTRLLFGGITEGADGNTYFSVFVSSDAGNTWTQVQGPDNYDEFSNYGGWEAAFAADDLDTLFIFGGSQRDTSDGPTSYGMVIGYSTNGGVSISDKTGNLITLEASDENLAGFLGICGGPTAT